MKSFLESQNYVLDEVLGIWSRLNYESISYSDGADIESLLHTKVEAVTDLRVLSEEIRKLCMDWESNYHLSAERVNILRPFSHHLVGSILEIGAGCGAITRFLGECGGQVLALEGSKRRAGIARSRTRDLDNVTVVAESFENLSTDIRFDVITLIGVLEYANKFTSGSGNRYISMLEQARRLLKPEGILIVAIENQFGLKYFAGAREDHYGLPMMGVEDYHCEEHARTFGRSELDKLLEYSGFTHREFYAAFPDYKFASSVISHSGLHADDFNAGSICAQSVRLDMQLPEFCHFSPELVWPGLSRNNLAMDLANSFVVIASPIGRSTLDDVMAFHYSTNRLEKYCKETRFTRLRDSSINVDRRMLNNGLMIVDGSPLLFECQPNELYVKGELLSQKLQKIVISNNWGYHEIAAFINEYFTCIKEIAVNEGYVVEGSNIDYLLPGSFFDAIPQNIIIDDNGNPHLIDREWISISNIRSAHLVFRMLLGLIGSLTRFGFPIGGERLTRRKFIEEAMDSAGFRLTNADMAYFVHFEAEVQSQIMGRLHDEYDWSPDVLLPMLNSASELIDRGRYITRLEGHIADFNLVNRSITDELCSLHEVIKTKEEDNNNLVNNIEENIRKISDINHAMDFLRNELENVILVKEDQEARINQLNENIAYLNKVSFELERVSKDYAKLVSSRSWLITKPLRFLFRVVRGEFSAAFSALFNLEAYRRLTRVRNAAAYILRGDISGFRQRLYFYRKDTAVVVAQQKLTRSKTMRWGIITTGHTLFVSHLLADQLRSLSWDAEILINIPDEFDHDLYIVLCPHAFDRLPPGERRIVFQMEQSISSRWFTDDYIKLLESSLAVLDYSLVNIENLVKKGIIYPHVYYIPIGASSAYGGNSLVCNKKHDVLFYGDSLSSPRRRKMLEALSKSYSVTIVGETFGQDMIDILNQARVIVNIHYYENALLETPRIQECLSLGLTVVSESSQDQSDYPEICDAVIFFEEGSIKNMIDSVGLALDLPNLPVEKSVQNSNARFSFMFSRFLISMGFLPASHIINVRPNLPAGVDMFALSLPETIGRRRVFNSVCPPGCVVFDGIRRRPGWIGCGLSYAVLARHALKQGLKTITVMEDDVILPDDFTSSYELIKSYLDIRGGGWDIFSGVIAHLHSDTKIINVEEFGGRTFVTIDKMTSTVFNIYNQKALALLTQWDPEYSDAEKNTIDRYLESQKNLRVVVMLPFFVGHREEVYSTLWGFQNSRYLDLISESEEALKSMVDSYEFVD